jgi:hypothetical protein
MTIFFLLSNTDGYPIWKLNRYKKLFATDVKAFARRFFSKQIFWKMSCSELSFFHFLEIYCFVKTSLSYQTYELSICWWEHAVESSEILE